MGDIAQVIKYEGDHADFIWKHPLEYFNASTQLIVSESQEAIFFLNGQALDLFGPGRYTLEPENLPLISRMFSKLSDDRAPFRCEIYFINKIARSTIKWGTSRLVRYMDPDCNSAMKIGASGEMTLRVEDSRKLLVKIAGTGNALGQAALTRKFRSFLMTRLNPYLAQAMHKSAFSIFEVDSHMDELSLALQEQLVPDFSDCGLSLERFIVTAIVNPNGGKAYKCYRDLRIRRCDNAFRFAVKQRKAAGEHNRAILDRLEQVWQAELKAVAGAERLARHIKIVTVIICLALIFAPNPINQALADRVARQELIEAWHERLDAERGRLEANRSAKAERLEDAKTLTPPEFHNMKIGGSVLYGTFGGSPLEWIVLAKEGRRALIITRFCITKLPYNDKDIGITWENCSLRRWLNSDFYDDAFTEAQKERIMETEIVNADNKEYGTEGGNDTVDKVFLLSVEEAERYFRTEEDRMAYYAGGWNGEVYYYSKGWEGWWLRSPGRNNLRAANIVSNGYIHDSDRVGDDGGVRPVLWLNLGS
ncbi:MAG: SPFH domain-containing protein [Gracilibacteraceae bacterium]|jgi:hypothetical protein|nr:SPFH domain-containing protein [Gracilibacteraceae bacterium]